MLETSDYTITFSNLTVCIIFWHNHFNPKHMLTLSDTSTTQKANLTRQSANVTCLSRSLIPSLQYWPTESEIFILKYWLWSAYIASTSSQFLLGTTKATECYLMLGYQQSCCLVGLRAPQSLLARSESWIRGLEYHLQESNRVRRRDTIPGDTDAIATRVFQGRQY